MKKNSPQTLTPKLRFPEFRKGEGWSIDKLNTVAEFVHERVPVEEIALKDYVSTENILPDFGGVTTASKLPPTGSATRFRADDILVSNIRPYLKKVWSSDRDGGASNDVIVIRAKSSLSKDFFPFVLRNESFIDYVMTGAKGVKMPRGDIGLMKNYPVSYPSHPEQQKIADCLTPLDELIAAQGRKVEALKAHKKGLMQQLFPREGETTPRLRFPEFRKGLGWDKRRLGDFIHERGEIAEGTVPLYSLTIQEGVTAKTDRYERSFLVTNKEDAYKLVLPNDFAFNPMNLRFGAIGRHSGSEPVSLSKYYNIFFCDESVDPRFCEIYFRSDGMVAYYDVMATGTLIEKRRVHFDRFLSFSIPFPQIEEQQRIANCLSALDARITAEADKLAALKTHKQGLMQQLFPSPEESKS